MQKNPATSPIHYAYLDGLRGFAAVYVAMFHLLAWVPSSLPRWITRLQKPVSFGHVAVSIFIVLSGYSLMLPVVRSPDMEIRGGWRGYLKRRAWRILPAYYAAVLLGIAVCTFVPTDHQTATDDLSRGSIATHLLLIHNWFLQYNHTINGAHWSVAAEWQIYFLFPFLFLPIWRRFGRLPLLAAAVFVALLPLSLLPQGHNLWWTCPWYVALFAIGNVAATTDVTSLGRTARIGLIVSGLGLAGLYLIIDVLEARHGAGFQQGASTLEFLKDATAGCIVAAFLIYCTSSLHGSWRKPIIVSVLESRPLVMLGAISYSLYLTHFSILQICIGVANRAYMDDLSSFRLRLFVGLPAAIILGWLFHMVFERPFLNRGPRRLSQRKAVVLFV